MAGNQYAPRAAAFDGRPRASFAQISFPITKVSVKGAGRQHIHEYPHANGGQPEKLGRKLYVIHMHALFYDVFDSYGNLWPQKLNMLVDQFEAQNTQPLVVPTVGVIQAFCTSWNREADFAKVRSGEAVDLEFQEDPGDQSDAFFVNNVGQGAAAAVTRAVLLAPSYPTAPLGVLQSIQSAISALTAPVNQASMFGASLLNQVNGILALFKQADSSPALQNPINWPITAELHNAAAAVVQYSNALALKSGVPMLYTVTKLSSVGEVSTAIFGDATHAVEILQTNAIDDALAIPAGTSIRYLSRV